MACPACGAGRATASLRQGRGPARPQDGPRHPPAADGVALGARRADEGGDERRDPVADIRQRARKAQNLVEPAIEKAPGIDVIGRAILERCESEACDAGFRAAEMMATLPGVPLYEACGYEKLDSVGVPVGEGIEITCIRMRKEFR